MGVRERLLAFDSLWNGFVIVNSNVYSVFFIFMIYETVQLVQWIHNSKHSIMYPGYQDMLHLTKLFLIILILGSETMEYGLFQIATACDK